MATFLPPPFFSFAQAFRHGTYFFQIIITLSFPLPTMATTFVHNVHHQTQMVIDSDARLQKPVPSNLPQRPAHFNRLGKEALVKLNHFNVIGVPSQVVYQYDVSPQFCLHKLQIPNALQVMIPQPKGMKDPEKGMRALSKKLWLSSTAKAERNEAVHRWIYDGNKLAW